MFEEEEELKLTDRPKECWQRFLIIQVATFISEIPMNKQNAL